LVTSDPRGLLTSTTADDGVLANDRDPEGDDFSATLVNAPTKGSLSLNANGTFTYIPGPSALFGTTDKFTYIARDVAGASSPETTVTITIGRPPRPVYQNPTTNQDVNADGFVSPIDVLVLVNLLNSRGPSIPVAGLPGPPDYVDVDGDNFVTTLDVLNVINYINAGGNKGSSGGEGEGSWVMEPDDTTSQQFWSVDVGRGTANAIVPPQSSDAPSVLNGLGNATRMAGSLTGTSIASGLVSNSPVPSFLDLSSDDEDLEFIASDAFQNGLAKNQSLVDQALSDLFGE
jgi:hypothetical protein